MGKKAHSKREKKEGKKTNEDASLAKYKRAIFSWITRKVHHFKENNWFKYPFFLTHPRFLFIYNSQIIIGILLWALMALEINKVNEWLQTPSTFVNPIGGFIFAGLYRYVLRLGEDALGMNINVGEADSSSKAKLRPLFNSDDAFSKFQRETLTKLKTRKNWIIAAAAAIPVLSIYYVDLLLDPVHFRVAKEWDYYSLSGPSGILATIIFPWCVAFSVGVITTGSFMVLNFICSISTIGQDKSILAIKELEQSNFKTTPDGYSLIKFRKLATIIPELIWRITFIMFGGLFLLNLIILNIVSIIQISDPTADIIPLIFICLGIGDLSLLTAAVLIFILPQRGLREIIKELKTNELKILESLYEPIRMKLFQSFFQKSDITTTYQQFDSLKILIDEINSVKEWPFDYRQGFGFISGILVHIITICTFLITLYTFFYNV